MNKVACVTGAASGIGFAIAKALAADGFHIAIVDLRDESEIAGTLKEIAGEKHVYIHADISSSEDRERIAGEIMDNFGRLDLLVNNAGVAPAKRMDILAMIEESYDRVMAINLKGPFFLTQLLSKCMIELVAGQIVTNPKIVNISSMSAYTSSVSRGEYCISKAGVSMMTKLFADRLAEYGINVYELRPGIIRTPMTDTVSARYDELIGEENLLPIRRWGEPEDIAEAVLAIAREAFAYSTGQVFNIDGGFHLRRL